MQVHAAARHGADSSERHAMHGVATFWFALIVTGAVILLPTLLVTTFTKMTSTSLAPVAMWVVTGSLSACMLIGGTNWWMRQPGSTTMSFGELMVWRWIRRKRADEMLQQSTELLDDDSVKTRHGQLEMLRSLNAALEIRDPYTRGHARRVERHAYRTALAMHRSVEDIFNLRLAASLHDIGKIEVPIEIIRKQGPLDEDEWAKMKQHPATGAELIGNIGHGGLVSAVRHHHERWDGGGYPDGISGRDIPLHARIISVCDTFDAITSSRSYRSKSSREKAIAIIKKESGKQFDPEVVDAFLSALPRGVPGVAALSWLSFPALKRGLEQFMVMGREAGVAGLAGAIATSGAVGATTAAVDPAKYLNRPAVTRSEAAEHASNRARARAAAPAAVVLGESISAADATASERTTNRAEPRARANRDRRGSDRRQRSERAERSVAATAKAQPKADETPGGQAAEKSSATGLGAALPPGQANKADAANDKASGRVENAAEDTTESVEATDTAEKGSPPGQVKSNGGDPPDTAPSETKGNGKPK